MSVDDNQESWDFDVGCDDFIEPFVLDEDTLK
jgi:hypothetical protein